ncbi:hypothetical protein BCR33DRAFT_372379 [Rhizoclosmatium globosum]|uniref:Uncharacterized protein n=1 Tax=Rhizoclosmatium globosum TaxID=329046 RepID=A0A1Y2BZQ6_9FUNG|nr:hypothetical protein BCR33DRAFT_372379 [Rhizoclosmatium globosum]|eukprot:ORY40206.1 hypothetical protein BCR33DRAFT_372379 [Rhizoclosmatium globosum]
MKFSKIFFAAFLLPTMATERLALPSTAQEGVDPSQLEVGGASVTLDHLGPIVVNTDGTMSRISNWEGLSEGERKTALRVVAKRNKERLAVLAAQEQVVGVNVDANGDQLMSALKEEK